MRLSLVILCGIGSYLEILQVGKLSTSILDCDLDLSWLVIYGLCPKGHLLTCRDTKHHMLVPEKRLPVTKSCEHVFGSALRWEHRTLRQFIRALLALHDRTLNQRCGCWRAVTAKTTAVDS